jgi:2-dehydropantoate 2-reductase
MNWVIVGQGALGSLLAIKLQQQGQSVSILTRNNGAAEARQLAQQQLQFTTITLQQLALQAQPTTVIAAVKAYQLEALLEQLSALPAHCQLLLSYNGMLDNEAQLLPANCLHWVTTHGAYRDGEQVRHAGLGQSWLGWHQADYGAPPQALLTELGAALPPLQWKADIQRQRWHKLAINCLINPFTVLHNCRNGELLNLPISAAMLELASEISVLARQLQQLELAPQQLLAEALAVAEKTANNRSSMLSDVLAGRPTEIAYLNGFVVRQSAKLGLTASANQRLWQQLQQRGA